jgi:WD40 repeat protein
MTVSGGGQLTLRQHQLSRDGRLLLVCAANNVRGYSAVTGEQLFTLTGHTDEVTCLALHPTNPSQVRSKNLHAGMASAPAEAQFSI